MAAKRLQFISLGAVLVSSALCINSGRAQSAANPQVANSATGGAAVAPKKAEEQFKNIQVLKGIPAEQVFPTMQFITASLGVECEFCHVQNAFDKDDKKPKQAARKMMQMMFAINKDNCAGPREVTCSSCHRGIAHPAAIPSVMAEDPARKPGEPHGME